MSVPAGIIDQFRPSPYVDALLVALLRAPLAARAGGTVRFYTNVPPIPETPYVFSHMLGGEVIDPRFGNTRAVIRIDAVDYGQFKVRDLLGDVLMRLQEAVAVNRTTPHGCPYDLDVVDAPMEIKLDGQAENVWRQTVTIALFVTPTAD